MLCQYGFVGQYYGLKICRWLTAVSPRKHLKALWSCRKLEQHGPLDERRIQVLKEDGKTAQSDKWMWVTRGGPLGQPCVLFEYDPSRAGLVPERLLHGLSGTLQADGYAGYNLVCKNQNL